MSLLEKVINQALRVLGLVGHHPGEMALVVRVVDVEALGNEVGVVVVLGEDDGLAQPVAAGHLLALGHQVRQHLVHGVGVEQPFVQCGGINGIRRGAVLVPLQRVPLLFFLFAQVVVLDAFALELERNGDGHWAAPDARRQRPHPAHRHRSARRVSRSNSP